MFGPHQRLTAAGRPLLFLSETAKIKCRVSRLLRGPTRLRKSHSLPLLYPSGGRETPGNQRRKKLPKTQRRRGICEREDESSGRFLPTLETPFFCDLQDLDLQPEVRGLAWSPYAQLWGQEGGAQQRAGHLWPGPGRTGHRREDIRRLGSPHFFCQSI